MIAYLKGEYVQKSPTAVQVDVNGVGYEVLISLNTYSKIQDLSKGIEAGLTVLIKADGDAVYKNVIDVVDELNICNVGLYAIVDMGAKENELLKEKSK